jgi:hypothetical protein
VSLLLAVSLSNFIKRFSFFMSLLTGLLMLTQVSGSGEVFFFSRLTNERSESDQRERQKEEDKKKMKGKLGLALRFT